MKNLKKNNKGFSLVELIVVVLIIAIIAVALAPQVMKWVGEATKNTKENNAATIKSAVQTVVAEAQAKGWNDYKDASFTVTKGATSAGLTAGAFKTAVDVALEGFDDTKSYSVSISDTGVVTVTAPSN